LFIAISMILSSVAIAKTQVKGNQIELSTVSEGTANSALGPVVWDNGMEYSGLAATQWDESIQFDTYTADDFHFDEDTEVWDVHWVGGYWGTDYQTGDFNWCISFMLDDGTGESPDSHPQTPSYAGPFCFDWSSITQVLLDDTGSSIYYELSVILPDGIMFPACYKFWIAIWAEGAYPPQSGWGYHEDFQLNPAVWGSDYFGFAFWTPGFDVQGFDFDMCFQLTAETGPVPPTVPTIDGPTGAGPGVEVCYDFHSYDDNGDMVRYHIDWGDGSTETTDWYPACTPVNVCHTYTARGTYVISAYAEDETGLISATATFTVVIPRSKALDNPLVQQLLGRLFNAFPMLKYLFGF
jgi:hypothetical protein